MIKYLKPLKLFQETLKTVKSEIPSVLLGLNVSDKFVSLAISDRFYMDAQGYDLLHRDESLLDILVYRVQNCGYDLEGIIIGSKYPVSPPINIHNLINDICKKGKFESLKYTYWNDIITSPRADYRRDLFTSMVCRNSYYHRQLSRRDNIDISSAVHMLQASLDVFNVLVEREKHLKGFKEKYLKEFFSDGPTEDSE